MPARARLAFAGPLVDRAGRRLDAGRVAVLAKAGRDGVPNDSGRDRVGNRRLETIADLQAYFALGEEDHEDHAVVEALLAYAPALGQLDREVLEIFALGRAKDGDGHLDAGGGLALREEALEPAAVVGREQPRVVVDARGGRGWDQQHERECSSDDQTRNVRGPEMAPDAPQRSERVGRAGRAPRPPLICPAPRTSGAPKWPPTPPNVRNASAEPAALLDHR